MGGRWQDPYRGQTPHPRSDPPAHRGYARRRRADPRAGQYHRTDRGLAGRVGLPSMVSDETKIYMLRDIATGFNTHDLDQIMAHFTDDCVFEPPRGPDANGRRGVGAKQGRAAFAERFAGIPDVRYTD